MLNKIIQFILGLLVVLALGWGLIGCSVFEYKDCRKVGHSKGYCLIRFMGW